MKQEAFWSLSFLESSECQEDASDSIQSPNIYRPKRIHYRRQCGSAELSSASKCSDIRATCLTKEKHHQTLCAVISL